MVEPDVKYEVVKAMEYWASGFCICKAVKVLKGAGGRNGREYQDGFP